MDIKSALKRTYEKGRIITGKARWYVSGARNKFNKFKKSQGDKKNAKYNTAIKWGKSHAEAAEYANSSRLKSAIKWADNYFYGSPSKKSYSRKSYSKRRNYSKRRW